MRRRRQFPPLPDGPHRSASYKVGRTTQSFDMSKGFHKYGVDWQPDFITTYVDGVQTGRIVDAWRRCKGVPMYLIANSAVGTDLGRSAGCAPRPGRSSSRSTTSTSGRTPTRSSPSTRRARQRRKAVGQ